MSDRVLHRVLPARAERYCLTVWLDGEGVNAPHHVGLRQGLTLVHCSAQLERFLWNMGCA